MADRPEGPIRVALIGYGLAGAVFHGPLISSTPDMSLATIVTGDPGRRARATSDHPDARLLAGVDAQTARLRLSAARGVIREAVEDVVG